MKTNKLNENRHIYHCFSQEKLIRPPISLVDKLLTEQLVSYGGEYYDK